MKLSDAITKGLNKHTPGPWEVDSGMVQTYKSSIPIAWMDREPGNGTMPVERDANARLIAAAPELLEAAKEVETLSQGLRLDSALTIAIAKLYAAIAKAEGNG